MKIALVIHSKTGNTLSVADKLKETLTKLNHEVTILPLSPLNPDVSKVSEVKLASMPEVKGFDVLILGAPVWGFKLSPVMQYYIANTVFPPSMAVYVFVTQYFPFAFLGGNSAIRGYEKLLSVKKQKVKKAYVIGWSNQRKREQSIGFFLKDLPALLP